MLLHLSEHMKKLEEEERARKEAEEAAYAAHMEELAKQESEEKGRCNIEARSENYSRTERP